MISQLTNEEENILMRQLALRLKNKMNRLILSSTICTSWVKQEISLTHV